MLCSTINHITCKEKKVKLSHGLQIQLVSTSVFEKEITIVCFQIEGYLDCNKASKYKSSHQRCSIKKGVLKYFAKLTRKTVNFVKFLRTPFLKEQLRGYFWQLPSLRLT